LTSVPAFWSVRIEIVFSFKHAKLKTELRRSADSSPCHGNILSPETLYGGLGPSKLRGPRTLEEENGKAEEVRGRPVARRTDVTGVVR
jgi:hypothetical protein